MRTPTIQGLVFVMAGVGCNSAVPAENNASQGAVGAAGSGVVASAPSTTPSPAATRATTMPGATVAPSTAPAVGAMTGAAAVPASSGAAPAAPAASSGTPPAIGAPADAMTVGAAPSGNAPAATGGAISDACRGFDMTNLFYSPGGDVLPNKCEAFHATLNNPYAVRCTDAWPWYKTQFPGDNFCILPPPPDKGTQVGVHPQGEGDAWIKAMMAQDMSAYLTAPDPGWTLPPGGEEERNIVIKHTNPEGHYYRLYNRMRGGSHHMIVATLESAGATFEWIGGSPEALFSGRMIPGAQRPDDNTPQGTALPPEDVDLYRVLPANANVQYNMHHFNSTDSNILKEAWQSIWWTENATTEVDYIQGLPLLSVVATFANPGETVDMHYASTAPAPYRLLGLFGHRHAWTTNFSAWLERAGTAEPQIVYQSFDWYDEPTFHYNSEAKNAAVNTVGRQDGAASGIIQVAAGDKLHFNCHIEYTDERAAEVKSPVTPAENGPLRFANQAYNAEMCILFGALVGDNGPMEQLGAPPDFAKQR